MRSITCNYLDMLVCLLVTGVEALISSATPQVLVSCLPLGSNTCCGTTSCGPGTSGPGKQRTIVMSLITVFKWNTQLSFEMNKNKLKYNIAKEFTPLNSVILFMINESNKSYRLQSIGDCKMQNEIIYHRWKHQVRPVKQNLAVNVKSCRQKPDPVMTWSLQFLPILLVATRVD